ncbi:hypothetical protein HDU93_007709 [Gonapodya sp. JEL0774]|nr:hypothetical protein HDU93_007709 [Gonapodya sp. JEL0774]
MSNSTELPDAKRLSLSTAARRTSVLNPKSLKPHEGFLGEWHPSRSTLSHADIPNDTAASSTATMRIRLGVSVGEAFDGHWDVRQGTQFLERTVRIMKEQMYLLNVSIPCSERSSDAMTCYVVFKEGSQMKEVVQSVLHATYLLHRLALLSGSPLNSSKVTDVLTTSLEWHAVHGDLFIAALVKAGWDVENVNWSDDGIRAKW